MRMDFEDFFCKNLLVLCKNVQLFWRKTSNTIYVWYLKKIRLIETENRLVVAKGRESSYHIITIPIFLTILYSHITYLIFAFSGPKFLCLLYLLILEWEKYSGNEKQSNYSQIYKLLKTRMS